MTIRSTESAPRRRSWRRSSPRTCATWSRPRRRRAGTRKARPGCSPPDARLFVAALVGTGALVPVEPEHEELKSIRTPSRRGQGIGAALLHTLLGDARTRGIRLVSLETGVADFFWPTHRLYTKADFDECEPFGSYVEDPHSLFLSLRLS